jgi:hypothetical protein
MCSNHGQDDVYKCHAHADDTIVVWEENEA